MDDYVTLLVKENGMVSGVEVAPTKDVKILEAGDHLREATTATTMTLTTHSKSWSSLSTNSRNFESGTETKHAMELLTPLYSGTRAKVGYGQATRTSRPYQRSRSYKMISRSADCLVDDIEEESSSESQPLRKCLSSSALPLHQSMGDSEHTSHSYQAFTWSPTNIRSASSLFSSEDVDASNRCEGKGHAHSATVADVSTCGDVSPQAQTLHSERIFAWSPTCIRSPESGVARKKCASTPPLLSQDSRQNLAATSIQINECTRQNTPKPYGDSSESVAQSAVARYSSFEWSPLNNRSHEMPSLSTETERATSIPSEVILNHDFESETVENQSDNDTPNGKGLPRPVIDLLTSYRKESNYMDYSSEMILENHLLNRIGEWAARNPFLGACSPHPGDWCSMQSSSFTDIDSSLFSSACSPSSCQGYVDMEALMFIGGDHAQSKLNVTTSGSVTEILGDFQLEDLPTLQGYSADDERSGRAREPRISQFIDASSTPMTASTAFASNTTLELGETMIRTNDIRALAMIMGQWAQTLARDETTASSATPHNIVADDLANSPAGPHVLEVSSNCGEVESDSVQNGDGEEKMRELMFVLRETTSSTCTDSGMNSKIEENPIVYIRDNSPELEVEDATEESNPSDSAELLANHASKDESESITLSSEEAASLFQDEDLRAVILLTDNANDTSVLFPSFSISTCFSGSIAAVESDDGLKEELGALDDAKEELRRELENAQFIMQSIYPVEPKLDAEAHDETKQSDVQIQPTDDTRRNSFKNALHSGPTALKTSPLEVDQSPASTVSSTRRVRFSKNVEEFVFIKDTRVPSEDDFETFGTFLSSRFEHVFCAMRDLVEEWECGTPATDVATAPLRAPLRQQPTHAKLAQPSPT